MTPYPRLCQRCFGSGYIELGGLEGRSSCPCPALDTATLRQALQLLADAADAMRDMAGSSAHYAMALKATEALNRIEVLAQEGHDARSERMRCGG